MTETLNIIKEGETILVYGNSHLLAEMLVELHSRKPVESS